MRSSQNISERNNDGVGITETVSVGMCENLSGLRSIFSGWQNDYRAVDHVCRSNLGNGHY